jgi:hypothetical protein
MTSAYTVVLLLGVLLLLLLRAVPRPIKIFPASFSGAKAPFVIYDSHTQKKRLHLIFYFVFGSLRRDIESVRRPVQVAKDKSKKGLTASNLFQEASRSFCVIKYGAN